MVQRRNRIVGHDMVDPKTLKRNPLNWRLHPDIQAAVLTGVLDEVGWVDEISVNVNTGVMTDGHLRLEIALRDDEPAVPVKYLDLTEEEQNKILATYDPISSMATTHSQNLQTLISQISTQNSYVQNLLDELLASTDQSQQQTSFDDLVEPSTPENPTSNDVHSIQFRVSVFLSTAIERDALRDILLAKGFMPEIETVKVKSGKTPQEKSKARKQRAKVSTAPTNAAAGNTDDEI